jgi:hypothetical protein
MVVERSITLDLFPPTSWEEDSIVEALEIQEEADRPRDEQWDFTQEEMRYLARCIRFYMKEVPPEEWVDRFMVDTEIDFDDPHEDGRYVIGMVYPDHLEPPASLIT